jgi:DNA-directed RNA polymerase specialized sigma24 family protein
VEGAVAIHSATAGALEEAFEVEAPDQVAASEQQVEVRRLLATLPPRTREVLSLLFLFDLPRTEIAERFWASPRLLWQPTYTAHERWSKCG